MNPLQVPMILLQDELRKRGLATTGTKRNLIARLDQCDSDRNWLSEIESSEAILAGNAADVSDGNEDHAEEGEIGTPPPIDNPVGNELDVAELTRRYRDMQFEFERRENELLRRELEITRRENEQLRQSTPPISGREHRRDNINAMLELVGFFDGSAGTFRKWEKQIRQLCTTYHLDDDRAKLLVSNKLKGKAKYWFQAEDTIVMSLDEIMDGFKKMYDHRPMRVALRKKFEAREWKTSENFADYFHDKIILAKDVPIDEEEMVDYLIDGIPNDHIQDLARMKEFSRKEDIDRKRLAKQHILVVVDAFTKYTKLYATKTTSSKESIECLKQHFASYSRPKTIVSDRGTSFTSNEFEEFLRENNIRHVLIATGSPKANGQVERINRVLSPLLAKLVDNDVGKYWYKALTEAEFAINNTINKSTGDTPSRLLFGVNQRGQSVDKVKEHLEGSISSDNRNIEQIRDKAGKNITKSQEYNQRYFNKSRKKPLQYEEGDYVGIRNFDSTPGAPKKLIPEFKGPYEIAKVLRNDRYIVRDVENFQATQRPYEGTWEASNIRPWQTQAYRLDHDRID